MIAIDRRWDVNGVPLDDPAGRWVVHGDVVLSVPAGRRRATSESAYRHGEQRASLNRSAVGHQAIKMIVTDLDEDGAEAGWLQLVRNRDHVNALLAPFRPMVLGLTPNATDSPQERRVANVEFRAAGEPETYGIGHEVLSFAFDIVDSFWRDAEPVVTTQAGSGVLRGGSAPITDAKFMVPGAGVGTRVRIRDQVTGAWVTYEGNVPVGQYVRIEPDLETAFVVANPHAWAGGAEHLAGVNVGPGGFELSPEIDWSSTVSDVRVRARRAYQ